MTLKPNGGESGPGPTTPLTLEARRNQDNLNGTPPVIGIGSRNDDVADLKDMRWETPFGDIRDNKGTRETDVIRIVSQNIGGFPKMDRRGSTKFMRMREETRNMDCVGWSEINRNWLKINAQQSLHARLKPWWPRQKTIHTWLKDYDWPSEYQQGGTSLTLTSDKLAKYGQEKGDDMSGLGRWVWQTLEGHSDVKTVIIQAYRPTRNTTDNGSTFMQQRAAADEEDPIKIFDTDILEMLDTFIKDGFQIVLMGDFNTPLNGMSRLEKELAERGINDAIRTRYGYVEAPSTHQRGSNPIDAIYVSETIEVTKGGYDPGMPEISDHRLLWVDISMDSLLGIDRGEISRPKAKRLQLSNRAITERFNKTMLQQMDAHQMLQRAKALEKEIGDSKTMTPAQMKTYEGLDEQRCRATECAEKKCARKPPDQTEFSAKLKIALGKAIVWQQILRKIGKKQRIHMRWLIDLKQRLGISEVHFEISGNVDEMKQKSTDAFEEYKALKQKAPELRAEFLDLLIQQAEDTGEEDKAKYLREVKARETSKDIHTNKQTNKQTHGLIELIYCRVALVTSSIGPSKWSRSVRGIEI